MGKSWRRYLHSLKVGPKIYIHIFFTYREENSHVLIEKIFYFILKLFQNKKWKKKCPALYQQLNNSLRASVHQATPHVIALYTTRK